MKHSLQISFFFCIAFLSSFTIAQNSRSIDSLLKTSFAELNYNKQLLFLLNTIDSLSNSQPEIGLEYGEYAKTLSEEINNEELILQTMIRMAQIYSQTSQTKKALDIANEIKIRAYNSKLEKEYASSILIISHVYSDLGEYSKSSNLAFEALQIFEKLEDKKGVINALYRIGNIYFEQEKWEKSLDYSKRALQISKEINYQIGLSRGLNNIAADYGNMGEFDNFENYIRQAIIINRNSGQKLWEGINYFNLGIINRENKQYDSAYYYYQKAEALFNEINNIPKKTAILGHFSKYYEDIGDYDQSLLFAEQSYELAKMHDLKRPIHLAAKRLHYIYLLRDDLENAYKYSQIESLMKDSLNLENSTNRMIQLELLYEFEKQEQIRKLEKERTQFFYTLSTTIVISVFILIIILLSARHRLKVKTAIIKRKELEIEIDSKNKELTSNVMSLMRKNETLSDIAEKLLKVRDEAVKEETKEAIEKLAKELEKSTDKEIWEEFEVRFQQVHTDFYENLLKKYPNLTPSEQRLCAFLKLNMTTKEISELTGIRTSSLEISRSRLRKKLGISNTKENLVGFLNQI